MADPLYRSDIDALAAELRQTHGAQAFEFAVETAKQHLQAAAWKHVALWLQVVNHLTREARVA
jgi:hypothetical protein